MTTTLDGLNRNRDLVFEDVDKGELGTGTSAPTESDTGLETPDVTTLKTLTLKTKSTKSIKYQYELLSTEGSNNTYTEFSVLRSTSPITYYDRSIFTGISFTVNGGKDLLFSKVHNWRGQ